MNRRLTRPINTDGKKRRFALLFTAGYWQRSTKSKVGQNKERAILAAKKMKVLSN
jgi:hypothetical protein